MSGERPLTAEEETEIKARHHPYARDPRIPRHPDDPMWCEECGRPWPCDAARLLLSFAAVEQRLAARTAPEPGEGLRAALEAYVEAQGRMLDRWAEGDEAVKRDLWQKLHACEEPARAALAAAPEPTAERLERHFVAVEDVVRVVFDRYHRATGGTCVFGRPHECVHSLQVRAVVEEVRALARPADETGSER